MFEAPHSVMVVATGTNPSFNSDLDAVPIK